MAADPERINLVPLPETPTPVAPPVPRLPQEPIPFPAKYRKRRSLLKVALAGTVGAALSYPLIEPIKEALRAQEQKSKPSGGEMFNPTARSGEISSKNTIAIPVAEAIRRSKQESTKVGDLAIPLPFNPPEGSHIEYEVTSVGPADNVLVLRGVPKGTIFYSPVGGRLSWMEMRGSMSGQNMTISIKNLDLPWAAPQPTASEVNKDGVPVTNFPSGIGFSGKDLKLLFPESRFNTQASGNYTFSSSIEVKAGDPIFEVTDGTILDVLGKKIQIGIGGTQPHTVTGLVASQAKPINLKILSENDKAIVTP